MKQDTLLQLPTGEMHPCPLTFPSNEAIDFAILYKQYYSQVMLYIKLQSGGIHPEAEDIAQDIFLILWRRRNSLVEIGPLESYLFIMVKNRLINESKKTARRRRIWKQIGEEPAKFAYSPYHEIYSRKAERWLQAAIDILPHKPQKAYVLREFHGLKVHKIATLMGISQAGASRQLQEAEKRIRSFLARQII